MAEPDPLPLILFGACDRHNLGDLLFPHLAATLLAPQPVIIAGLAERDLTPFGGQLVRALASLVEEWGDRPARILHVGGELLTCSLYEAAVMVQTPSAAADAIARYDRDVPARTLWAETQVGLSQEPAYLVPRNRFRNTSFLACQAIGGACLDALPRAMRVAALTRLREADWLTVRDHATQAHLAQAGMAAAVVPDNAVLVADLFGARIALHDSRGEPAQVHAKFPQGYIAVQFSAEFCDDATLAAINRALASIVQRTGLGIVLFRAGAAPWHDSQDTYRRLAGALHPTPLQQFDSLDIWDLCALIAGARAYLGSSLHGRILASAFARPGVNFEPALSQSACSKPRAYLATWHANEPRLVVEPDALSDALLEALSQPRAALEDAARTRARLAQQSWDALARRLRSRTAAQ